MVSSRGRPNNRTDLHLLHSLFELAAASCEVGFFHRTGGQLHWAAGREITKDSDGIAVLLSESSSVINSVIVLLVLTLVLYQWIYRLLEYLLVDITTLWTSAKSIRNFGSSRAEILPFSSLSTVWTPVSTLGQWYHRIHKHDVETAHERYESDKNQNQPSEVTPSTRKKVLKAAPWLLAIFCGCSLLTRPSQPYRMMSATLPLAVFDFLIPPAKPANPCEGMTRVFANEWPLPNLLNPEFWKDSKGDFKGWAPRSTNPLITEYRERRPEWLPSPAPPGFERWNIDARLNSTASNHAGVVKSDNSSVNASSVVAQKCAAAFLLGNDYNPVDDPLRISNLDLDILEPLRSVIDSGDVDIKHVVLIQMESIRTDLFPLQQDSPIHKLILETHPEEMRDEINRLLSELTPNAERITGLSGGFVDAHGTPFPQSEPIGNWHRSTPEGFGGVTVGAFSSSSLSMKAAIGSHCGAWPLPVNTLDETESPGPYQPCLPQVLDLFSQSKRNESTGDTPMLDLQWSPTLVQAVTEEFDRQDVMDKKMGFHSVVSKQQLAQEAAFKPDMTELNYFGYEDRYLRPYLEAYMDESLANNKRMSLSHFTSITHHPWAVPADWPAKQYIGGPLVPHERRGDFNGYLNTVRYHDWWLGEVLQMLEDKGVANETLVVFAGDHGMTFLESEITSSALENPHVNMFKVPVVFRHPRLPRVQYAGHASSLSVLPTVLDLLATTGSLDEGDAAAARDLVQEYEGQSLIRPYKAQEDGRRAWNFGLVNLGGRMLAVTSADTQWRLLMPVDMADISYQFTAVESDPFEKSPVEGWDLEEVVLAVERRHGKEAAEWSSEAAAVGEWWVLERKRLWQYEWDS